MFYTRRDFLFDAHATPGYREVCPGGPLENVPHEKKQTRFPREVVIEAGRRIKSRSDLMPTSGPSEPHRVSAGVDVHSQSAAHALGMAITTFNVAYRDATHPDHKAARRARYDAKEAAFGAPVATKAENDALEALVKAALRPLIGRPLVEVAEEVHDVLAKMLGTAALATGRLLDGVVDAWWTALNEDVATYEALDLPFAPDVFETLSKWPTPPRDLPVPPALRPPRAWATIAVDPDLDPNKTHMAVLYADGTPYNLRWEGTITATDLAALVRAAGLGAEAVGDTVCLSLDWKTAATWSVSNPNVRFAAGPNRAQRRLRPGKRPPDTSAKNAGPTWRGGGR